MAFLKSFLIFVLSCCVLIISGCSKQDKQEYVDDKPVNNSNTGSDKGKQQVTSKNDSKPDTSSKLPGTNIPKQNRTYEHSFNPVAVISPLEANDYLGKEVTVNGFVADVHKTD